jgi:hypothetical protein
MAQNVSRLDSIIEQLEKLHKDAQNIFDAHIDCLMCDQPRGTSFGALKARAITTPAGSALNYIEALKLVRERILGPRQSAYDMRE